MKSHIVAPDWSVPRSCSVPIGRRLRLYHGGKCPGHHRSQSRTVPCVFASFFVPQVLSPVLARPVSYVRFRFVPCCPVDISFRPIGRESRRRHVETQVSDTCGYRFGVFADRRWVPSGARSDVSRTTREGRAWHSPTSFVPLVLCSDFYLLFFLLLITIVSVWNLERCVAEEMEGEGEILQTFTVDATVGGVSKEGATTGK